MRPGEKVLRFPRSAGRASRRRPSRRRRRGRRSGRGTDDMMRWTWLEPYTGWLFLATLLFNLRAAWKLAIDWAGMLTTIRFVARRLRAPRRAALGGDPRRRARRPGVPARSSPPIRSRASRRRCGRSSSSGTRASGPGSSSSPRRRRMPRPTRRCPTAPAPSASSSSRTCRPTTPSGSPTSSCRGPGARPSSSTGRSGPRRSGRSWRRTPRSRRGSSSACSTPIRCPTPTRSAGSPARSWRARRALAYQGVTLSLANWSALGIRGRICAIQQSSIFTRVSLARLVNEVRRIRLIDRLTARIPGRAAGWARAALELGFRRSQICLGHHQFVRLDVLQALGGFPTGGATEDSTLGYMLGARGILIRPMPMIELTDLPETKEKIIRQNARWYQGVLDDVAYLWATWRAAPTAFNLAQLVRHVGQQGPGVADRRVRLPGHGIPRLALRLRLPARAAAALLRRGGGAHGLARAHDLGRRHRDAAGDRRRWSRTCPGRSRSAGRPGASGSSPRSAARPTGCSRRAPRGGSCGAPPATAATSRARRIA